jgi:hypothetical protein
MHFSISQSDIDQLWDVVNFSTLLRKSGIPAQAKQPRERLYRMLLEANVKTTVEITVFLLLSGWPIFRIQLTIKS